MNTTTPSDEPSVRRGKIARLPHQIREQLNRRLHSGEEGRKVLEWLNALPEVQAILASEFDGQQISDNNLSRWRHGGYREWEAKEEDLDAVRALAAEVPELNQGAGASLSDNLASRFTARLALALRRLSASEDNPALQLESLATLCRQVVELRRGEHDAQWLQLERERLALHLQKYRDEAAARASKTAPSTTGAITVEGFQQIESTLNLM